MSEPARNRFALDLEELERQLRAAGQESRPSQPSDPLAELTRIVGQDDPLKELFSERRSPAPRATPRQEPSFEIVPPRPAPALAPVPPAAPAGPSLANVPPEELRGALDEFEALLRRTEPRRPASAPAAAPAAAPAPQPARRHDDFDLPEPLPYGRKAPAQPVAQARDLDDGDAHAPPPFVAPAAYAAPAYAPSPYAASGNYAPAGYDEDASGYGYGQPGGYAQAGDPSHDYAEDELPDMEPRRSRKGLWAAAAVIAVGVVGVGMVFSMRGGSTAKDGQPPLIAADSGPVKVEPANPGGTEIPNQNKQIYERSAEAPQGKSRVVASEEQPIDLQQLARSAPARIVGPGPVSTGGETVPIAPAAASSAAPATPGAGTALAAAPSQPERSIVQPEPALTPMPPVPGLGEPRRVRTVSIRPDGTPAQNPIAIPNSQPVTTGSAPARSAPAQAATPVPAEPPMRIAAAQAQQAAPVAPQPAPRAQERATTPPAATTPAAPTRLASAPPERAPAAPASAAVRAGTGDFVVQLGAPGSEAEARATFAALQRKYPEQLSGQSPIIRKTELAGGKTVFRLRVGPYSREDASSMCTALQAAGGQCFIAKN